MEELKEGFIYLMVSEFSVHCRGESMAARTPGVTGHRTETSVSTKIQHKWSTHRYNL